MKTIKKGDYIRTPRFLNVKIEKVCRSRDTARKQGYTEPTHYMSDEYDILRKHTGPNTMTFAAIKKSKHQAEAGRLIPAEGKDVK